MPTLETQQSRIGTLQDGPVGVTDGDRSILPAKSKGQVQHCHQRVIRLSLFAWQHKIEIEGWICQSNTGGKHLVAEGQ